MEIVSAALSEKNLTIEQLSPDLQSDIADLQKFIAKYNEACDEYESLEEEDKETEKELDDMEAQIATLQEDIAKEIKSFVPAASETQVKQPEKEKSSSSVGWLAVLNDTAFSVYINQKLKFMKKVLLLAIVSMFSFLANAQFKKSDKILEGSVSYSKTEGSDAEYSVSPSLGIFLSDKFAIGVGLSLGKDADGDATNFGAYGRYYFLSVGKNLSAYTPLDLTSNNSKSGGVKTSTFSTNVGVGANYFISKNLALSAHICDLMSYSSDPSTFSIGFSGISNPLAMSQFGLLIKL